MQRLVILADARADSVPLPPIPQVRQFTSSLLITALHFRTQASVTGCSTQAHASPPLVLHPLGNKAARHCSSVFVQRAMAQATNGRQSPAQQQGPDPFPWAEFKLRCNRERVRFDRVMDTLTLVSAASGWQEGQERGCRRPRRPPPQTALSVSLLRHWLDFSAGERAHILIHMALVLAGLAWRLSDLRRCARLAPPSSCGRTAGSSAAPVH